MQTNPDHFISRHWQPTPINPPKPDPEIEEMNGPQRSAEVIRYSLLSMEFWISPGGKLREWIRLNSKLSVTLLIPSVLVFPLVTWITYLVAGWAAMLVGLAGNLIVLPIAVLAAVVSFKAMIRVLKAMSKR